MLFRSKFDPTDPPKDFLAWARQIAYHKVLDFYKKSRRLQARLSQVFLERISISVGQSPDSQPEDRREALAKCIEKLSPRARDILTYRFVQGATTQSTATLLGKSVDSVYKALAKLRQSLFQCAQKLIARENRS